MSQNCIQCVKNQQTGPDPLCDECRASGSSPATRSELGDNLAVIKAQLEKQIEADHETLRLLLRKLKKDRKLLAVLMDATPNAKRSHGANTNDYEQDDRHKTI